MSVHTYLALTTHSTYDTHAHAHTHTHTPRTLLDSTTHTTQIFALLHSIKIPHQFCVCVCVRV